MRPADPFEPQRPDHDQPPELTAVLDQFRLPRPRQIASLGLGTMNDNWRVDTADGPCALKRILDIDLEQAARSHRAMVALAERGFPVPTPVTLADGRTILSHDGHDYALLSWSSGTHRIGGELDHDQVRRLGRLLARLHGSLADLITGRPCTPIEDHHQRLAQIDALLGRIGTGDDPFDQQAREILQHRARLLRRHARHRPQHADLGPAGAVHGDFQQFNLLWRGSEVTGILDWDRVQIAPYSMEVVRAAILIFDRDIERTRAFVDGYREISAMTDEILLAALQRRWWSELCALWMFERHYLRGQTSADRLIGPSEERLRWWCEHRDDLAAAFRSTG